jgi:hypothetical protein
LFKEDLEFVFGGGGVKAYQGRDKPAAIAANVPGFCEK